MGNCCSALCNALTNSLESRNDLLQHLSVRKRKQIMKLNNRVVYGRNKTKLNKETVESFNFMRNTRFSKKSNKQNKTLSHNDYINFENIANTFCETLIIIFLLFLCQPLFFSNSLIRYLALSLTLILTQSLSVTYRHSFILFLNLHIQGDSKQAVEKTPNRHPVRPLGPTGPLRLHISFNYLST